MAADQFDDPDDGGFAYHPGEGAAWDKDIPVARPSWAFGMKRQGQPSDPNMRTESPDVGSRPAEWMFPTKPRAVRGGV